MPSLSKALVSF
jgi:hypothetical protein